MVNKDFSTINTNKKIPFAQGYNLTSTKNIPQWFLQFQRQGFEEYLKTFSEIQKDKDIFNFLQPDDFTLTSNNTQSFDLVQLLQYPIFDIESYTLVLLNGKYSPLSYEDELPFSVFSDGIENSVFDDAEFLEGLLTFGGNPFVALNSAYINGGIVIDIKDGETLEKPINIISIVDNSTDKLFISPRIFLRIGKNVKADFIITNLSLTEHYFENNVSEIFIGQGAKVNFYTLTHTSPNSCIVENNFITTDSYATFNKTGFIKQSGILKSTDNFIIKDNAQIKSYESFNAKDYMKIQKDSLINHDGVDGKSDVSLFAVANDNSNVSFKTSVNTKSLIDNIETQQMSKILLASENAVGNIKPFQTISSEGVKAFHGAVVSGVNPNDLFYLESRGIDSILSKNIILNSCLANILQNIKKENFYNEYFKFLWL